MDLYHMRMFRFLMHFIGSWPYRAAFGQDVKPLPLRSTRVLFVGWAMVFVTGVTYLIRNFSKVSFFELGQTYLTVMFNIIGLQRVTMPWVHSKTYPALIKTFINDMHLIHHRQKGAKAEEMFLRVNRLCATIITYLHAETFLGIFVFNIAVIFNNYRLGLFGPDKPEGKLFEHSINYSLPFNYTSNLVGYIIVASVNLILSYDCGLCFCAYDLLVALIVFHTWGHLKILGYNLRNVPTPQQLRDKTFTQQDNLKYTPEENKKVGDILKDIVNHHRLIKAFMAQTSEAFGPMLCLYYTFHQISGCILLLECSKMDTASMGRYIALTVTIFQMFIQMSIIVELLGSQSDTLGDAVYSVPWEYMNTSNRKIVFFLLCNVQEPIRLTPMGMVSIGVQTMATILKTTFSYFMLLRTI